LSKTGVSLLNYQTPFFGEAIQTHVAGTHGKTPYGPGEKERQYLNVLCGKHLVRKYLAAHQIPYPEARLPDIVNSIKDKSAEAGRSITRAEVDQVVASLSGRRP
jgi:2-isopropylmalate synthase